MLDGLNTGRGRGAACICTLAAIAVALLSGGHREWIGLGSAGMISQNGGPRLVSIQPLPDMDGPQCQLVPASANSTLVAALTEQRGIAAALPAAADMPENVDAERAPVRVIRDTFATYSAIAVDNKTNEVFLQDENLFGIKVFNRLDNTPPSAKFTEPKRMIGGISTKLEFNCGLYIDPDSGDVYSVNNDTTNDMVVFPHDAAGNIAPKRELRVPHGAFGIAVDEAKQELYLTIEHENSVVVFPKMAEGNAKPLRTIAGPNTLLADPHGIAIDPKNNLMYVTNHGSGNDKQAIGSGKFTAPSITVYSLNASGDVAPLRVIQGPKAQLDWPMAMTIDIDRGELYIANDTGDSILVFRTSDSGDAAPVRMIKGQKTGISHPTGIYLDLKNNEVWASNMGNHRATVYPRMADGDVAPLRTIRSAPDDKVALAIGNPGGVAYDSKRQQYLVPNCVAHPQIAVFNRLGGENAKPERTIAGQKTLLARTMHDIRYDAVHDEVYVTNPFAQAILVFRGGATGEDAPIRIIQGPKTLMSGSITAGVDRLEVDPVNNEIYVPSAGSILVFPREGSGDIAPIRILKGPDTNLRGADSVAIDAVHNVMVIGGNLPRPGGGPRGGSTGGGSGAEEFPGGGVGGGSNGALMVFNRTDSGNVKPKAIIGGPKAAIIRINQLQVYAPKGWIVAAQPGAADAQEPEGVYIGIWSINDNGDVPPRWFIPGTSKSVMKKPRGVTIDPQHKEIIVADMRLNAVLTYSFPEMFQ